jgi:hypothetical protein
MTKLEEDIFEAMGKAWYSSNPNDYAKAAARVAKKYIEKAIKDFEGCGCCQPYHSGGKEWLKENGVTE